MYVSVCSVCRGVYVSVCRVCRGVECLLVYPDCAIEALEVCMCVRERERESARAAPDCLLVYPDGDFEV